MAKLLILRIREAQRIVSSYSIWLTDTYTYGDFCTILFLVSPHLEALWEELD